MDEEELKCYAVLGMEPPQSENNPEAAEPGDDETAENAEERSEEDGGETADTEPAEEPEGEKEQEPAEPAQTREERARHAAERRKAERDAAVEKALKAEREKNEKQLGEVFKLAGFKNADGTEIKAVEEMRTYLERAEQTRLQKDLKAGKLTPEAFQKAVETAVAKAMPEKKTENNSAEFEAKVEKELEAIRAYNPDVQTVADFKKLDRANEFFDQVANHGHSFQEAYEFVYADKIAAAKAEKAAEAAAQRARVSAKSKDHLNPIVVKGTGDVAVPADVLANFRRMIPGMSEDEARKYYQKYVKETKG